MQCAGFYHVNNLKNVQKNVRNGDSIFFEIFFFSKKDFTFVSVIPILT